LSNRRLGIDGRPGRALGLFACRPERSRGRLHPEPDDPLRSPFQRDRDRIVHSTAFRRLEHKTQVFVSYEGDHFRSRLTHTLEVAQIARTAARALALDEDLAEAVAVAVEAVSEALDGRELSRDDLHEELRGLLPGSMLPWCEGCGSHHARRGLLVMACLHGRLCIAGRAGRQPLFARTDRWTGWDPPPRDEAATELVRRFRAAYPPADPAALAGWAGISKGHADELWELAGDEEPRRPHVKAKGVRLLAAGDPLLLARDRELLVPDKQLRARIFRPAGSPGVVLADGELAGLWRARKKGRRLEVEVEELGRLDLGAVEAEAERIAPLRGCTSVAVGSARS
jgi:hypothetical protein